MLIPYVSTTTLLNGYSPTLLHFLNLAIAHVERFRCNDLDLLLSMHGVNPPLSLSLCPGPCLRDHIPRLIGIDHTKKVGFAGAEKYSVS